MDVARTLYTSAVKKLFDRGGGGYSPCSPNSSYTYEWYISDRMSTILLLYCRCFTVIYRYQLLPTCDGCHASYISWATDLLMHIAVSANLLCCDRLVYIDCYWLLCVSAWGSHACACSTSYIHAVHHRLWPWPLSTCTSSCSLRNQKGMDVGQWWYHWLLTNNIQKDCW